MTEMTLIELAELHVAATGVEIEDGKEALPKMAFIADDEMSINAFPQFGNPAVKQIAMQDMRRTLAEAGATMYVFIMEAWMSRRVAGKTLDESAPGFVMPRNDPNRSEVLIVCGATREGETLLWQIEIKRHAGGKLLGTKIDAMQGGQLMMALPLHQLFDIPDKRKAN